MLASEGHIYAGDIAGGAWIDAQHLKPGDELLGANNNWQTVETVLVEAQPLNAYNLTVDEYSTYFVAGAENADAVWVHNDCYVGRPKGFRDTTELSDYGQKIIENPDTGRKVYQGHPPNDDKWYDIDGSPPTPRAPAILSAPASFQRGSNTYTVSQGTAASGWKHIYDRHIDRNRPAYSSKSKFPGNWTAQDVLGILERTIKHGTAGSYAGLRTYLFRTNYKGAGYRDYRVTINADGSVRTFHPMN